MTLDDSCLYVYVCVCVYILGDAPNARKSTPDSCAAVPMLSGVQSRMGKEGRNGFRFLGWWWCVVVVQAGGDGRLLCLLPMRKESLNERAYTHTTTTDPIDAALGVFRGVSQTPSCILPFFFLSFPRLFYIYICICPYIPPSFSCWSWKVFFSLPLTSACV